MTICSRRVDFVVIEVSKDRSALIFRVKQSKKINCLGLHDPADAVTRILRKDVNDTPSATATLSCSETSLWQTQKLKSILSFWKEIETRQEELVVVMCFLSLTVNFTFLFYFLGFRNWRAWVHVYLILSGCGNVKFCLYVQYILPRQRIALSKTFTLKRFSSSTGKCERKRNDEASLLSMGTTCS